MITAERLRELFNYDPETGVFTRLVSCGNQFGHIGAVAGYISGVPPRDGYRKIKIDGRTYKASRLAWLYMRGKFPVADIDHINLVPDDDRLCNLREATAAQNRANTRMLANNASGYKGVTLHRQSGKWRAVIKADDKQISLGCFDTKERAFIAYCFAAWRHFGDFARIDADYLVGLRRLKAERKKFERSVLWNLANPDSELYGGIGIAKAKGRRVFHNGARR